MLIFIVDAEAAHGNIHVYKVHQSLTDRSDQMAQSRQMSSVGAVSSANCRVFTHH